MIPAIRPCPTLVARLFHVEDFVYEEKVEGYCMVA
jgi:hypothetical protein